MLGVRLSEPIYDQEFSLKARVEEAKRVVESRAYRNSRPIYKRTAKKAGQRGRFLGIR